jgi:Ca2+-binding EF-hand superfamily protein
MAGGPLVNTDVDIPFAEVEDIPRSLSAHAARLAEDPSMRGMVQDLGLDENGNPLTPRSHMAMAAFKMFDEDGSGELDVHEFHKAMVSMGLGYSFEDAENLFMMMDTDGSGLIGMSEFLAHCQDYINNAQQQPAGNEFAGMSPEDAARQAFRKYDDDGNGWLDVNEFMHAMKDLGLGTTFEDAENLFSMVDEDGSGTMEEEEFVQHCMDAIVAMQEEDDNEPTPALMRQPTALGVTMSSSFRQQGKLQLTGDADKDARLVFEKFDIDKSGYLDIYEFMAAMRELGLGFTFQDAQSLFDNIDTDGDGTMELNEFVVHYKSHCV